MIRLLPFILIPVLIAGVIFWRFFYTANQHLDSPTTENSESVGPVEVPKTLPGASLEDRVKTLEDSLANLINQFNSSKSNKSNKTDTSLDSRLKDAEAAVTDLKVRVSSLEKSSPAPVTSSSATTYIPLGAGGDWGDRDWYSLSEYEVSLDSLNFPGYKNMNLEVTFKLSEVVGTGSVRLYNLTDSQAISGSDVNTTASSYSLKTSSSFNIASGTKTYRLQVKSTEGKNLYIQSARIKVNF